MIVVCSVEVLGYIHVLYPNLSVYDKAVCIHEAGFAQAYAFYLSTCEHYACRELLLQIVVELSFAILYVYRFLLLFCHCRQFIKKPSPFEDRASLLYLSLKLRYRVCSYVIQ